MSFHGHRLLSDNIICVWMICQILLCRMVLKYCILVGYVSTSTSSDLVSLDYLDAAVPSRKAAKQEEILNDITSILDADNVNMMERAGIMRKQAKSSPASDVAVHHSTLITPTSNKLSKKLGLKSNKLCRLASKEKTQAREDKNICIYYASAWACRAQQEIGDLGI